MKTKKIAFGCFIGGALFCLVALSVAPTLWWLGLIAGMISGYIAYEAREFGRATVVAGRQAAKSTLGGAIVVWKEVHEFFSEPRPFCVFSAIIGAVLGTWFFVTCIKTGWADTEYAFLNKTGDVLLTYLLLTPCIMYMSGVLLIGLSILGTKKEKCYWYPFIMFESEEGDRRYIEKNEAKGLQRQPKTYANVTRWICKGLGVILGAVAIFLLWKMWKYLGIGFWKTLCFLCRFTKTLIILVHSKERVLCALDGTLGGAISYFWLAPQQTTILQSAMIVFFGGILGVGIGILNWEIVSKRILKIQISTT